MAPDKVRTIYTKVKEGTTIFQNTSDQLEKLRKLADQSQNVLFTFSGIFPLDLCPDTVIIDANKVNIIERGLFGVKNIHSILVEDITNLTSAAGLFSATLEIVDSSNLRFPINYSVRHLKIRDALMARKLIQGLISAKREGIDLSSCLSKDVIQFLEILGHAKGEGLH